MLLHSFLSYFIFNLFNKGYLLGGYTVSGSGADCDVAPKLYLDIFIM